MFSLFDCPMSVDKSDSEYCITEFLWFSREVYTFQNTFITILSESRLLVGLLGHPNVPGLVG